ncbi:MAG: DUF1684 domain-containing protein [Pseudomonadota bacterium]
MMTATINWTAGPAAAAALGLLIMAGCHSKPAVQCAASADYEAGIAAWREERIANLKKENGWLSLAGLYWLEQEESSVGSDPAGAIVLPSRAPALIGTIFAKDGEARIEIAGGVEAFCNGEPVSGMVLYSEADPERKPDRIAVGDFTFFVIKRGERLAVRLYDKQAESLLGFKGIETFPAKPCWRIEARFEPYDEPKIVKVSTIIHTTEEATVPGEVVFTIDGKEHRLTPMAEPGAEELFFVFADATSGKETYGGGRFLDAPLPVEGKVVLDFNKAYNPPCAFTPYATCPVARPENRLEAAVTAGEKKYRKPGKEDAAGH